MDTPGQATTRYGELAETPDPAEQYEANYVPRRMKMKTDDQSVGCPNGGLCAYPSLCWGESSHKCLGTAEGTVDPHNETVEPERDLSPQPAGDEPRRVTLGGPLDITAQTIPADSHEETLTQTTAPLSPAEELGYDSKAPEGGKPGDAMRANSGKPGMHLLPPLALMELARHFDAGAKKYAPHNWLKGGNWSVCHGAMLRHIMKWQAGQDVDPETNTHHMASIAWNALVLLECALRGLGRDDRMPAAPEGSWPPPWAPEAAPDGTGV